MKSKFGTVPRVIASGFLLLCLGVIAFAQEKAEDPPPKRKGSIKGKVLSDDGQPLEGASININAMGTANTWRQIQADDEGNFVADGLAPALYGLYVFSTAYVEPGRSVEPKFYRLGETVTFTLVKGGVLTGRVTNALGEPVIAVPLRVEQVSDLEGRKIASGGWYGQMRKTDDRGVYRVYGLPPGKYVVSVGGSPPHRSGIVSAYEMDVPTFYPSTSREGATEITVNAGEEVRGIDIRYRREKGHSISGKITGAPAGNAESGVQVMLFRYPSSGVEMNLYIQGTDPAKSFAFFTVPDGEYELEANVYGGQNKTSYKSSRQRVTVKGGNVANIELRLSPLGSVEAKLEWEATPEKDRQASCQSARAPWPEETMFRLVKDDPKPDTGSAIYNRYDFLPNEKNELKFSNLEAASYRFAATWLDEAWYIKTITLKGDEAKAKPPAPQAPTDIGKQGLPLKPGEQRTGVVLRLANGAASLSGRVTAEKNQALPSRLRVHLVPAEKEAADDVLRYAEQKSKDGTFTFANLAPGKYWLLARKVAEDEPDAKRINPLAWDITTRKTLRAEAEAANVLMTVTHCQKVNDASLKFTPRK